VAAAAEAAAAVEVEVEVDVRGEEAPLEGVRRSVAVGVTAGALGGAEAVGAEAAFELERESEAGCEGAAAPEAEGGRTSEGAAGTTTTCEAGMKRGNTLVTGAPGPIGNG
jgi:hypothetical protein